MKSFGEKVVIYGPAYPMNLTPLWVAHDKGFFREEGLDVTLEAVLGIPDAQHPRHKWRKVGKVVFASPGGSPMFRSVRERRGPEDSDINVISIADGSVAAQGQAARRRPQGRFEHRRDDRAAALRRGPGRCDLGR